MYGINCITIQNCMKAVHHILVCNPYGAPTVFMTGCWINLRKVCHIQRRPASHPSSSGGEISLRTAGFSYNLKKARSAKTRSPYCRGIHIILVPTFFVRAGQFTLVRTQGFVQSFRHPAQDSLGEVMLSVLLGLCELLNNRL